MVYKPCQGFNSVYFMLEGEGQAVFGAIAASRRARQDGRLCRRRGALPHAG